MRLLIAEFFHVGLWRAIRHLDGACFPDPLPRRPGRPPVNFLGLAADLPGRLIPAPRAWPPTNYAQGQLFLPVLLRSSKPRSYAFPCREVPPVCGGGRTPNRSSSELTGREEKACWTCPRPRPQFLQVLLLWRRRRAVFPPARDSVASHLVLRSRDERRDASVSDKIYRRRNGKNTWQSN